MPVIWSAYANESKLARKNAYLFFAEYSAGGAVQLQVAFLDHAFMRLPRALDAISQFAAFVGKRPDDFVIPFGSSVADAAAEAHQLPGSKLMFHASLQFFDASLRQRCAAEKKIEKPPRKGRLERIQMIRRGKGI